MTCGPKLNNGVAQKAMHRAVSPQLNKVSPSSWRTHKLRQTESGGARGRHCTRTRKSHPHAIWMTGSILTTALARTQAGEGTGGGRRTPCPSDTQRGDGLTAETAKKESTGKHQKAMSKRYIGRRGGKNASSRERRLTQGGDYNTRRCH